MNEIFSLVFKTLHRRGDPPAALDEFQRRVAVDLHNRSAAQKPAEIQLLAGFFADSRNQAHSGGF